MREDIIKELIKQLEVHKGETIEVNNLAYELFNYYNMDRTITYNRYIAQEWINKHRDEIGPEIEDMKEFGLEPANPFTEPEELMLQIYLEVAYNTMLDLKTVHKNESHEILLNDETIGKMKKELELMLENL